MDTQPVIVGVDGSPGSLAALDLAVREASRRDVPLRIVHADEWAAHPAWVDTDALADVAEELAQRPERVLSDALERAAGADVPVDSRIVAGPAGRALLRESAGAALLVVGHRSRGGALPDLLLGSVARKVAVHAACPVLIAYGRPEPDGDVVVGVDACPADDTAVGFAFEEAALRGADLVVLHAWQGPADELDDMLPPVYLPTPQEEREARVLAEALAGWDTRYPHVVVRRRLVRARAGRTLIDASTAAQLVVIGSGRPGTSGLPFRSVRHALLHHAACPVAVIHHA